VRLLVPSALLLSLLTGLLPGSTLAQQTGITREHHPWGRFAPGAWKVVRVVTETLDEKGAVKSSCRTETRTTLKNVEDDGVTLLIEAVVQFAGRQFHAEPQTVKQGFHGDLASQNVGVKSLSEGRLLIDERSIPCKIEQLELTDSTRKTVTKIYYSDTISPYVLRRESLTTNLKSNATLSETTVQVESLEMPWPFKALGDIKTTAYVKAVHKNANGTTVTFAVTSPDVPGGVVFHSSTERDKTGRLVRCTALELTGFGREAEPQQRCPFLRRKKRSGLFRKSSHISPQPAHDSHLVMDRQPADQPQATDGPL